MNRMELNLAVIAGFVLFCLLCCGVAKFGEATGWKPEARPSPTATPPSKGRK